MNYYLNLAFSLSIVFSVIIGWARYRKTDPAFFPFLLLVSIAAINEITSIAMMNVGYSTIININLFELIESILLTWQFLKWGLFEKQKRFYFLLQFVFIVLWATENFISAFHAFASYFIIVHSFALVMMSISMINRVVLKENGFLLRNSVFLICLGLIIFNDYAVLIEAFYIFGLHQSRLFRLRIFEILAYVNLITNLIFTLAFLWTPMRPRYILQS